jgi:dihydropteroate synthase
MNKRTILNLLASNMGVQHPLLAGVEVNKILGKAKGQLRQARPKASGAAKLKRAATKRNNIRKHK